MLHTNFETVELNAKLTHLKILFWTDWYSTFLAIAGLQPNESDAGSAITPVDGINMWPWIQTNTSTSPRSFMVYDHNLYNGHPAVGAIRKGKYKLMVGPQVGASWYGGPENNFYTPNSSDPNPNTSSIACSVNQPCLFDLEADPTEHKDISFERRDVVKELLVLWDQLEDEYHPPKTCGEDKKAFCNALTKSGGYICPWVSFEGCVSKSNKQI